MHCPVAHNTVRLGPMLRSKLEVHMKCLTTVIVAGMLALSSPAFAQDADMSFGPVFTDFGPTAAVATDMKIPKRAKFAVAFDTAKAGEVGELNRTLNTAARFVNMHVKAGVPKKHVKAAVIVHSKAAFDLTHDAFYGGKYDGAKNANADAIKALTSNNVRIILCGQTAAYYGVDNADLLPGVEMALSAMTAHALLQQDGYTLNPF